MIGPKSTAGITEHNVLQNGDKSYQKTNGGTGRDSAQLFDTISRDGLMHHTGLVVHIAQ